MDELFPTRCIVMMMSPNEVEETIEGYGQSNILAANIPISIRYKKNTSCKSILSLSGLLQLNKRP